MSWTRSTLSLAVVILMVAPLGCGGDALPLTKVSGTISFGGSPPPRPGRVVFRPVRGSGREGLPYRPVNAPFQTDGRFTASTLQKGDGLLPGTYNIHIECYSQQPGPSAPFDEVTLVPPGWKADDLVIDGDGGAVTLDLDVPERKR